MVNSAAVLEKKKIIRYLLIFSEKNQATNNRQKIFNPGHIVFPENTITKNSRNTSVATEVDFISV